MKKLLLIMFFLTVGSLVFAEGGMEVLGEGMRAYNNAYEAERDRQQSTNSSLMEGVYYPVESTYASYHINLTRSGNEHYFEWIVSYRGTNYNPYDVKGTPSGNRIDVTVAFIGQSDCDALGINTQGVKVGSNAATYNIVNSTSFTDGGGSLWQRR